MNYFLLAGEASGDLHAARLMKALMQHDKHANFICWGGDKMQKAGAKLLHHYQDLAFMGFWEVAKNLPAILKALKQCKHDILTEHTDILILVDYPGFNLKIAKWAHQQGFKVVWYISPQLWAWHQSRVKNIKRDVDLMLCILPFEVAFYKKFNIEAHYVGHPLLDDPAFSNTSEHQNRNIIALLPGSRKQEIKRHLPLMAEVAGRVPEQSFVIAAMKHIGTEYYARFSNKPNLHIVFDDSIQILKKSKAALVASGTATLEAALLNVPQLVCYKGSLISYLIGKRLVKVNYISLVNLVMNEAVLCEFIQKEMTVDNMLEELKLLLNDDKRKQIFKKYESLRIKLGKPGASERAASLIEQLNVSQSYKE